MSLPEITNLQYTYKKPEQGVWVLNFDDIPLNKDYIKDQQIVYFAPQGIGGNHKHPRTEWFIGIGDLVFVWVDELGQIHEELMNPLGQLKLIMVPPFLPHAVINKSHQIHGILYEMADDIMKDVQKVSIINQI